MSQASAATVTVHEWLPHLEQSASEVFDLMLNSKLRKGTPQLFPAPECTAMVGLAGSGVCLPFAAVAQRQISLPLLC